MGKIDGHVIFVEGALPEETVTAEVFRRKKNYAESRLIQIEERSPYRIEPRCRHFPLCGGCRLQHLRYDQQAEYKKRQLIEVLTQVGRIADPPVSSLIRSDEPFYYRGKMEYSFGIGPGGELRLGLHPRGRWGQVFDIEECFLQSEVSANLVVALKAAAVEMNLPAYDIKNHKGLLRYLVVREGKNTGERMVNIVTSRSAEASMKELFGSIVTEFPAIESAVNNVNTKKANIAYGEYENILHGRPFIHEIVNGIKYKISANSFFQSNPVASGRLFDCIADYGGPVGEGNVLDLYCGAGAISFTMAGRAAAVTGVDSEESAIDDARTNAELNGIENCEFFVADCMDYLSVAISEGRKFGVVIVDPPRAGIHPKMIPMLGTLSAHKLIYVSCNPGALARDCVKLNEAGYDLSDITCVDMFPQTPHIEAVALFLKS